MQVFYTAIICFWWFLTSCGNLQLKQSIPFAWCLRKCEQSAAPHSCLSSRYGTVHLNDRTSDEAVIMPPSNIMASPMYIRLVLRVLLALRCLLCTGGPRHGRRCGSMADIPKSTSWMYCTGTSPRISLPSCVAPEARWSSLVPGTLYALSRPPHCISASGGSVAFNPQSRPLSLSSCHLDLALERV